ncbi:MAG: hypothetical protein JZU65_12985, partial [Chlorobium sp.]|nr:hypothetical protein [Chlorobium sp.]
TYDFIDRLEAYLGKEVKRLGNESPFEHHLFMMGNMLPSPQQRWCTVKMKLEPFEKFVGTDEVMSYVAIRADEHREGYISTKPNIRPVFPFIQDEITRNDVFRILKETVGVPEYYKWRSRSGCFFCFFQRQEEWLGLYDNHPDLFQKAMEFEKFDSKTREGFSWIQGMTLGELIKRRVEIVDLAMKRRESNDDRSWQEKMLEEGDLEDQGCLICSL